MDFQFSDDAEALRTQARRFLADKNCLARARQVMEGTASIDPLLWAEIVVLGWTGLRLPESLGGLGLGVLELCVLAEEVGRALAPVPFISSTVQATEALMLTGSETTLARLAPGLLDGSQIGTMALLESGGGSPLAAPSARAHMGQILGEKLPVVDGGAATFAIVSACDHEDGDGYSWWLVDLAGPGVRRTPVETIDLVRKSVRIEFDQAPAERLGAIGAGAALTQAYLHHAAILSAFEALGSADAALDMAVDYAKQRVTFGRQIGSYQAVKHRCADMYIKNQLARAHAYFGAWALNSGAPELAQAAAGAQAAAIDAVRFAGEENVQLHGGIGFTWAADPQFFYRRSRHLALALGSLGYWREQLVRSLELRNRAA